ncbi:cytochrome P450 [Circinella umbellata]|nr:cytochrome P450 [Circinella umbellata]
MFLNSGYNSTLSLTWNQRTSLFSSLAISTTSDTVSKDNKCILTILSVVFSSYVVWKIVARKEQQHKHIKVKNAPGRIPFLGHTLQLYFDPVSFINRCKKERGPAFRVSLVGQEFYVMTGTLIHDMCYSPKEFDHYDGIQFMAPIDRILRICYQHKYDMNMLQTRVNNPVNHTIRNNFKSSQLGIFSKRIQQGLSKALEAQLHLEPGEKRELSIRNDKTLRNILLRLTSLCFIGSEVGDNPKLISATDEFCRKTIQAGLILNSFPEWFAVPIIRRFVTVEKNLDCIMGLLVPQLENVRSRQKVSGCHDEKEEISLASLVLNMTKHNGELYTPEEAALYFARISLSGGIAPGFATTFMLFEIARRPSLVNDLRKEIEKLEENERTPEKISQIKLLDSILREVFRCKISSLGMFHKTRMDVTLATGETVPRDCMTLGALLDAHTDPAIMKQTSNLGKPIPVPLDQFDPYRFLNVQENGCTKKSTSLGPEYITFGLSQHSCPGRYLGTLIIKYVVAEIFMKFNITIKLGREQQDSDLFGLVRLPPPGAFIFEART